MPNGSNVNIQGLTFMMQDMMSVITSPLQLIITIYHYIASCFVLLFAFIATTGCLVSTVGLRKWFQKRKSSFNASLPRDSRNKACKKTKVIGFFHPYCNAGGGGERVLWCAIKSLQSRYDFIQCVVYTGDITQTPKQIIDKARDRFNIEFKREVHFVFLKTRSYVEAEKYPFLTLLGQSVGSIILGIEALWKCCPDIYMDSMGYAFTLPIFKYIGGCKVGCYVHYPTISTDMLEKVQRRDTDFNNAQFISRSLILSYLKLIYYRLFAFVYGICGSRSDVVMVNSSWTYNHINSIWKVNNRIRIVYPPCDTKSLLDITIDESESYKTSPRKILSLAQFRPEKNHVLQLEVFHKFLKGFNGQQKNNFRLLLVGSCRNDEDHKRVEFLRSIAKQQKIDKQVEFHLNVSFESLLDLLSESLIGLHTMTDEHFGIGVVEFMAAGLIPLAHNSAGPKMDIVVDWKGKKTGYLANSADSYVKALNKIFSMTSKQRYELCVNARDSVKKRFSEENFKIQFLTESEVLLK